MSAKRGAPGIPLLTTIGSVWMAPLDTSGTADLAPVDPNAETLRLFADHGSSLYRFCCFTLGSADEAEDIVQDSFLKLLQHLQRGGDRSNLRAWLFAVAVNSCRDRLRWRVRWLPWRQELDRRTVEPMEPAPDRVLAREAVRSLSPRDRLLLSLRAQGLSYREIAAATGIHERSVGRFLARAVDRWKRRLHAGAEIFRREKR